MECIGYNSGTAQKAKAMMLSFWDGSEKDGSANRSLDKGYDDR
jgi:hypothetical protein